MHCAGVSLWRVERFEPRFVRVTQPVRTRIALLVAP